VIKALSVVAAWWLCATAMGQSVNLAWDASTSPGVTNYVIYATTNALTDTNASSALVKVPVGTNLTAKVFDLSPGMWWFGAKAVAGGAESKLSNVVAVEVPKPPAQMRTIAVQYSYTLTNFYDLGFFKLRIESP